EEALADASFEVATVAQIIVDANGRLAWANQKARVLFKLEHDDLGRRLQDLELSYRPVELRSRIDQVHAERHPIGLRYLEWPGEEGEQRFYDVNFPPLL